MSSYCIRLASPSCRWEHDDSYCQGLLKPSSQYYHGILEFTETAILDFLMGKPLMGTKEKWTMTPGFKLVPRILVYKITPGVKI